MLQERYQKLIPSIKKELKILNIMQVPRFEKVVLNTCISNAAKNPKILERALGDLTNIASQKMVIRKAKQDVAQFKIRKGVVLGGSVTLRRQRMWVFLDRLIHFALPRVRDFKGLSPKAFDGHGNYNFGIKEQIVFPEVDYDKVDAIRGFNVTICTTSKSDEQALKLFSLLGFPFRK